MRGAGRQGRGLVSAGLAALLGSAVLAAPAGAEELDCLVLPETTVTVASPVEGLVEKVFVERGDRVKQGQPLAALESSLERANLAVARERASAVARIEANQVRLDFAERDLGRRAQLEEQNILSARDRDEAERERSLAGAGLAEAREEQRIARLEVRRAEAALERRTIRSPVNGVVMERIIQPGEYAEPPPIVKVAQIDPLRVEVFAPVSLYGKVAVGMQAEVRPEEPVGGVHPATVSVVDPVIDAASGTFGVRLALANPDYGIPAGLKCRVRFEAGADGVARSD